jgi:hypothetical protein
MNCIACKQPTTDSVYIGKLRCCDRRVAIGRCCKAMVLETFPTLGAYAKKWAKLHSVLCEPERTLN